VEVIGFAFGFTAAIGFGIVLATVTLGRASIVVIAAFSY
jgi:hypothetical protein